MMAVIRLRGSIGRKKPILDTMKILNLGRKNTLVIVPNTPVYLGMLKKIRSFVTYGELSKELETKFAGKKIIRLMPPRKGFKSLKNDYPRGDLGYRGEAINDLIKRMM
jgi:large subunit ribosomal protein L30